MKASTDCDLVWVHNDCCGAPVLRLQLQRWNRNRSSHIDMHTHAGSTDRNPVTWLVLKVTRQGNTEGEFWCILLPNSVFIASFFSARNVAVARCMRPCELQQLLAARRYYASAGISEGPVCVCVCLCVHLSDSGIVSKRLCIANWFSAFGFYNSSYAVF